MTARPKAFVTFSLIAWVMSVVLCQSSIIVNAQSSDLVRKLEVEVLPESGCPVSIGSARAELDVDAFGAPTDVRIYVDYKNATQRPIAGVKFRVGYVDAEGKDRGTFHAPDAAPVGPGSSTSQKWRAQKIDPRVAGLKMRVLLVKYSDGALWESAKMKNIVRPHHGPGGSGTTSPAPEESAPAEDAPSQGGAADDFTAN